MSSRTVGRWQLPSTESPLDAADSVLTGGGGVGILLYAGGLVAGNGEAATFGVGVGVACVLGTLAVRSARDAVRAFG